jgi:hypothetical protein
MSFARKPGSPVHEGVGVQLVGLPGDALDRANHPSDEEALGTLELRGRRSRLPEVLQHRLDLAAQLGHRVPLTRGGHDLEVATQAQAGIAGVDAAGDLLLLHQPAVEA